MGPSDGVGDFVFEAAMAVRAISVRGSLYEPPGLASRKCSQREFASGGVQGRFDRLKPVALSGEADQLAFT